MSEERFDRLEVRFDHMEGIFESVVAIEMDAKTGRQLRIYNQVQYFLA